jgi:hypothetical protein
MQTALTELRDAGTTAAVVDRMIPFGEFNELVELDARYADEARFVTAAADQPTI